jgi:hypothetical protein
VRQLWRASLRPFSRGRARADAHLPRWASTTSRSRTCPCSLRACSTTASATASLSSPVAADCMIHNPNSAPQQGRPFGVRDARPPREGWRASAVNCTPRTVPRDSLRLARTVTLRGGGTAYWEGGSVAPRRTRWGGCRRVQSVRSSNRETIPQDHDRCGADVRRWRSE